jgi:hypothetical protein
MQSQTDPPRFITLHSGESSVDAWGEKGSLRLRLRFGLRQQGARLSARAFPCGLKSALPRLKPGA